MGVIPDFIHAQVAALPLGLRGRVAGALQRFDEAAAGPGGVVAARQLMRTHPTYSAALRDAGILEQVCGNGSGMFVGPDDPSAIAIDGDVWIDTA